MLQLRGRLVPAIDRVAVLALDHALHVPLLVDLANPRRVHGWERWAPFGGSAFEADLPTRFRAFSADLQQIFQSLRKW